MKRVRERDPHHLEREASMDHPIGGKGWVNAKFG